MGPEPCVRTSEIELRRELNDAHVPGGVQLSEVGSQYRRAARGTEIVGDGQAGVVAKDGIAGLSGAVRHVRGQVPAGVLRMVENIERLDAKLQVPLALGAERQIL